MKKGIIILLIIILIACLIWYLVKNKSETKEEFQEYIPQEEISEEQERQALVTLYFKNAETLSLMPEVRMVDAKLLIENPYRVLVELLIEGPKNQNLEKAIPEETKIHSVDIQGDMVVIDFSQEFVQVGAIGLEQESRIVYSIVNTLTELTEVNSVKFLINGEENREFQDGELSFKEPFARIK